jgi:hypothetical protein
VKIPDFVSPIIGYRVWGWDAVGLTSLNGERWTPKKPIVAGCRACETHGAHHAPHMNCTCGVYAAKTLQHLRRSCYGSHGPCGEVLLWGTVVEHQRGWRAQFAYPKNFVLLPEMMPTSMSTLEYGLNALRAYGVDIFICRRGEHLPLWLADSGYLPIGVDLLIQRCLGWQASLQQERRTNRHAHVCG